MGRYKNNFSLYLRKFPNGTKIWYYRTYTADGKRTSGISTNETSKTLARKYCENLFKEGKLYSGSNTLFGVFAKDFYSTNSEFVKNNLRIKNIRPDYVKRQARILEQHIMPFFKDIHLKDISENTINDFQSYLQTEKHFANNTINIIVLVLSNILSVAEDKELILSNPIKKAYNLRAKGEIRDSFSEKEILLLLKSSLLRSKSYYQNVLVSALTGMRIGETCGLRKEDIKDHYIDLKEQFTQGIRRKVKTKEARKIPLCDDLYNFILKNIDSFRFNSSNMSNYFSKSMREILHPDEKRNLCFHSLRHFYNTYMLSHNMNGDKVAAIMGHSTGITSMQSRYTNFKLEDYKELVEEQSKLMKKIFN